MCALHLRGRACCYASFLVVEACVPVLVIGFLERLSYNSFFFVTQRVLVHAQDWQSKIQETTVTWWWIFVFGAALYCYES